MNKRLFAFTKSYLIESMRNLVGLFFTVFFPAMFLLIFGFVFSGETSYRRTIGIYTDDVKIVKALEEMGNWEIKNYQDEKSLLSDVEESRIPMGLTALDRKVILYYQNSPSLAGDVKILELFVKSIIEKTINSTRQYIEIDTKKIQQTGKEITEFEYMMMGVIALSLFSNGMFSIITVFGNYKKKGVLRRLTLTGVEPVSVVSSVSLVRIALSFLSLLVVLSLCRVIFKATIQFNWFLLIPTVVFVTVGMMAIGVLLVSLFENPNTASNAASLLNTIMVFFSGVYFPISFMPSYIRWIAYILPVKYAADLVRYSANAQAMNVTYFLTVNLIFLVSGIVALWFSAKIFMRAE